MTKILFVYTGFTTFVGTQVWSFERGLGKLVDFLSWIAS